MHVNKISFTTPSFNRNYIEATKSKFFGPLNTTHIKNHDCFNDNYFDTQCPMIWHQFTKRPQAIFCSTSTTISLLFPVLLKDVIFNRAVFGAKAFHIIFVYSFGQTFEPQAVPSFFCQYLFCGSWYRSCLLSKRAPRTIASPHSKTS